MFVVKLTQFLMTTLFRHSTLFLLLSYLLISALPFLGWLLRGNIEHPARMFAYEISTWVVLWAVFKRPAWFHYLLLPAFLFIPVELYLQIYYGQGISTHHLGIIAETSPKEAYEFLGNKAWLLLLTLAAIFAWWVLLLRLAKLNLTLQWSHKSRWWIISCFPFALGLWFYGQAVGVASVSASIESSSSAGSTNTQTSIESTTSEFKAFWSIRSRADFDAYIAGQPLLPSWADFFYDSESFGRAWPLGIYTRTIDFYNERSYLTKLSDKNREFRFHAKQASGNDFRQTIVMVIGESSRYDRWSLNGYQRNTNPYLSQIENLVSFSDMVTAVAATRLSIPIITTRKPAAQSLMAGFAEKSFLSAYNEAGFKTFWISNQMSFGQFDTPTSVIAKEADVTQFLNLGGFTNTSSYDQILLTPFQTALEDASPNKLIVLHTLGNHWNYSHRYPKEYDQWKPSIFGIANPAYTDLKNKEALNNSYDNSILYTDWMLARVIHQLQQLPHMTALFYVSDHGQTLYDGSCNLAFHGHNTQFEFHIPAFIWYSPQYAEQHPQKVEQLLLHKNAKLSTENVFHTLLDMVEIRYPDERLSWSILSPQLTPHIRYVDSYGWSNYDNSDMKGDCREVMDRKTPLIQEK